MSSCFVLGSRAQMSVWIVLDLKFLHGSFELCLCIHISASVLLTCILLFITNEIFISWNTLGLDFFFCYQIRECRRKHFIAKRILHLSVSIKLLRHQTLGSHALLSKCCRNVRVVKKHLSTRRGETYIQKRSRCSLPYFWRLIGPISFSAESIVETKKHSSGRTDTAVSLENWANKKVQSKVRSM